jgi:hypothetical protein
MGILLHQSKQASLMPTDPKTTNSGKHIEPSKPAHQRKMPAFPHPKREVTLHPTERKDNDKSLLPAMQPDLELPSKPSLGCDVASIQFPSKYETNLTSESRTTRGSQKKTLGYTSTPLLFGKNALVEQTASDGTTLSRQRSWKTRAGMFEHESKADQ